MKPWILLLFALVSAPAIWRSFCKKNQCVVGRIDRKIEFPLPDEKTRRRIFQIHTKKMTLASDLDLEEYITAKDDLSGADIKVPPNQPGKGTALGQQSMLYHDPISRVKGQH